MDRAEWQQLALDRLADAEILLRAGRWAAAYYLVGYAVECALKSCIVAHLARRPGIIFEERNKKFSSDCWTHNIDDLVKLAALWDQREIDSAVDLHLGQNWLRIKDWKESSRYEQRTQAEAERLFAAVNNDPDGVLKWIRNHW